MSLPQAWEEFATGGVTATGDTIVVAVIDGGADWGHEDLNCWINNREIPNNGIDDDGNGYVDRSGHRGSRGPAQTRRS